ncbi:MAG: gluconeogenesis factor YvcK family protein, partial [Anaerovoracaceae bacterium]
MEYEYPSYTRNSEEGPRIVVIGGGTGLSVLLRGLKKNSGLHISAIVTVADDGGGSGMLRKDLGMLPPGDVRNCILALADEEDIMEQLLQYRFGNGRLKGQNMGNLFIAALTDIYGDFELAVEKLHDILRIKGKVVPVTSEDVTLCARLKNGKIIRGESKIPKAVSKMESPIEEVFLEPSGVQPLNSAVEAIMNADMIVLGPGSLYSSIIPNLLVGGISDAIRSAGGMKVIVCNVMTQAGETDDYTVVDYVDAIEKYLG